MYNEYSNKPMEPISAKLPNGLYEVNTSYLNAGFYIEFGMIIYCAPILRRRIDYWQSVAKRIGE